MLDAGTNLMNTNDAGTPVSIGVDAGTQTSIGTDAGTLPAPVSDAGSTSEAVDAGMVTPTPTMDAGNGNVASNNGGKDDGADKDEPDVEDAGCGCSSQKSNKSSAWHLMLLGLLGLRRRRD